MAAGVCFSDIDMYDLSHTPRMMRTISHYQVRIIVRVFTLDFTSHHRCPQQSLGCLMSAEESVLSCSFEHEEGGGCDLSGCDLSTLDKVTLLFPGRSPGELLQAAHAVDQVNDKIASPRTEDMVAAILASEAGPGALLHMAKEFIHSPTMEEATGITSETVVTKLKAATPKVRVSIPLRGGDPLGNRLSRWLLSIASPGVQFSAAAFSKSLGVTGRVYVKDLFEVVDHLVILAVVAESLLGEPEVRATTQVGESTQQIAMLQQQMATLMAAVQALTAQATSDVATRSRPDLGIGKLRTRCSISSASSVPSSESSDTEEHSMNAWPTEEVAIYANELVGARGGPVCFPTRIEQTMARALKAKVFPFLTPRGLVLGGLNPDEHSSCHWLEAGSLTTPQPAARVHRLLPWLNEFNNAPRVLYVAWDAVAARASFVRAFKSSVCARIEARLVLAFHFIVLAVTHHRLPPTEDTVKDLWSKLFVDHVRTLEESWRTVEEVSDAFTVLGACCQKHGLPAPEGTCFRCSKKAGTTRTNMLTPEGYKLFSAARVKSPQLTTSAFLAQDGNAKYVQSASPPSTSKGFLERFLPRGNPGESFALRE